MVSKPGMETRKQHIKVMKRKVLNTRVSGGWKRIMEQQRAVTMAHSPSLCKHAVNQDNIG